MSKEEMIAALVELGWDQAVVSTMSEEQMAESLRVLQELADTREAATAEEEAPEGETADAEVPAEDAAELPIEEGNPDLNTDTVTMSEAAPAPASTVSAPARALTLNFSEPKQVQDYIQKEVSRNIKAALAASGHKARQQDNQKFCEKHCESGQLAPANAALMAKILDGADSIAPKVSKFSEGGKQVTLGDLIRQYVEKSPPIAKFSEYVKDPANATGNPSDERTKELLAKTSTGRQVLAKISGK